MRESNMIEQVLDVEVERVNCLLSLLQAVRVDLTKSNQINLVYTDVFNGEEYNKFKSKILDIVEKW